ncbi:MAG: T9SS type A sorting domain-containing protein [Bacteroidota bacterium]
MKTRFLFTLLAGLLAFANLQAQTLTFNVSTASDLPGSIVTIDISVENFTNLYTYQGTISWDETVLDYQGTSSPFPGIANVVGDPGTGFIPLNKATFVWTDPLAGSTGGVTVDDQEVVLQISFLIQNGIPTGTVSNVTIDGSATPLFYGDNNFNLFTPVVNSGGVGVGVSFPVEMLDFQASAEDGNAKLEWITASETDNHYFEVQKSENGVDFFAIGTVEGAGTTQEHTYYQFEDQITASKLFYRLQQVDFDGTATRTDVVELSATQSESSWIQAYPNPSQDQTFIRLENWEELEQRFRIQVYSLDGRMLHEEFVEGEDLISAYSLDVSALPRASYLLKLSNAKGKSSSQILILE